MSLTESYEPSLGQAKPPLALRLLYVEDDAPTRKWMCRVLSDLVSEVIVATDGENGLAKCREHMPDLVLSDVRMPHLNGIAMCREIAREFPDIPVAFVSAYDEKHYLKSAFEFGAVAYIEKPIEIEALSQLLERQAAKVTRHRESEKLSSALALKKEILLEYDYAMFLLEQSRSRLRLDSRVLLRQAPVDRVNGDLVLTASNASGHFFILLADGMGHGLPAAMSTLHLPHLFPALVERGLSSFAIAEEINRTVFFQRTGAFVAAALIRHEPENHLLEVWNAGLPTVYLLDGQRQVVREFTSRNRPLGIDAPEQFNSDCEVLHLNGGASLLLVTDGITDALTETRPGEDGSVLLRQMLADGPGLDELYQRVTQELAGAPFRDDASLLDVTLAPADDAPVAIAPGVTERQIPVVPALPTEQCLRAVRSSRVLVVAADLAERERIADALRMTVGSLHLADFAEESPSLIARYHPDLVVLSVQNEATPPPGRICKFRPIDISVPAIVLAEQLSDAALRCMLDCQIRHVLPFRDDPLPLQKKVFDTLVEHFAGHQRNLIAHAFTESPDAILITDTERRIITVNQTFCLITGYSAEEVIGKNPNLLSSGRHDANFFAAMNAALARGEPWRGEVWNRRKNGELFLEGLHIQPVHNAAGEVCNYLATFRDITQQKSDEARIRHMAFYDQLTGLPNRVLLNERLQQLLAQAQRNGQVFALMFIDLDRFKYVNDALGHSIGDSLLVEVAARLSDLKRESDTLARLGGDEFVLLLGAMHRRNDAACVAEKIIMALARPFHIQGHELRITASIGISLFPEDGNDVDTLMRRADLAMYRSKDQRSGGGGYRFYASAMNALIHGRIELESRLRRALDNDEFEVFYQPKIRVASGQICGAEALVRWRQGDGQWVSPGEFIPLAEETGLIVPIGERVLDKVCQQLDAWRKSGIAVVPVAVNISPAQLYSETFAEQLQARLQRYQLPPELLALELTESAVIENIDEGSRAIAALRATGIVVALDDFGTGYSSLSYLKRLPIDCLKIDKSFVDDIDCAQTGEQNTAIVRAIVQMARALNLQLVTEGIERETQLSILREFDCDEAQGYLFSKPLPAEDFLQFLVGR